MADRWFFSHPNGHDTYVVDGDPGEHPDFQGWCTARPSKHAERRKQGDGRLAWKQPAILFDGTLCYGMKLRATQDEKVRCTPSCRKATQPRCVCSCGGKNHGVDNKGMSETGQEQPEVVYVGDY